MSEFAFPIDRQSELMRLLEEQSVVVSPVDSEPLVRRGSTWQTFQLVRANAAATLVVNTRWIYPELVVFNVLRDMRRIARPSTWFVDSKFLAEIDRSLQEAGGCRLGDGKG